MKRVEKEVNGVVQMRWSSTRWMRCNCSTHVGKTPVNRDVNGSGNIGMNLVAWAKGELENTTWRFWSERD